jgi:hypothetical protein
MGPLLSMLWSTRDGRLECHWIESAGISDDVVQRIERAVFRGSGIQTRHDLRAERSADLNGRARLRQLIGI